jgi:hypothetical protein
MIPLVMVADELSNQAKIVITTIEVEMSLSCSLRSAWVEMCSVSIRSRENGHTPRRCRG